MLQNFNTTVLLILLTLAIFFDLKLRKIPNFLTFPVIIWALATSLFFGGLNGLLFSLSGFLLGFAIFLIPFILGGMGAGDVKLMSSIGALMGMEFIARTSLFTAIAGGVIAIVYYIYRGELIIIACNLLAIIAKPFLHLLYKKTNNIHVLDKYVYLLNRKKYKTKVYIPYALAIGAGTLVVLLNLYKINIPFL